ncbi:MAG: long-chain fatty acid--CoA ligase [Thermoanaerobaculales bacterium]|jgi:fatty-acyl-CoA synthase|nr:long-chain fatty acid--CoA ligase [Thermoanaerobaculales bacterium]
MISADILGERSRLSPDRTALVEVATGRRFSYADLDARAVGCARMWLYGLGIRPGSRVGILSGNRVEFLDAVFAAAKSGIVLVPLNTRATPHELGYIVRDAGIQVVLYDNEHRPTVHRLRNTVDVDHWIALDEPDDPEDPDYAELVLTRGAGSSVRRHNRPEDPFCLLYTSGTTGRPKGVITPHRMVSWNAYNTVACWQLGETDVSPIFTPLYHAGGLGAFLMPLILAGGTVVLHAGFDAAEVWGAIETEKCTVVLGVPTIWKMLSDAPEFATAELGHVRWFISGGAPLPRHLIDIFRERGVVLRQGYGLTEVGVNCFSMTDEEAWKKAGSIGRPLMFTEAKVIDEAGQELPPGEVGELCFRGPHVSAGYWNNPEATAAAIDRRGWFHTGDMATCDEDGFFSIAGRAKDMFISGGVNVYPAEIENQLLQHPALGDAAVIGVPHDTWGEVGVAYVVAAEGSDVDTGSLASFVESRLARYKVPKEFIVTDELPRTAYGKVVKGDLVEDWKKRQEA